MFYPKETGKLSSRNIKIFYNLVKWFKTAILKQIFNTNEHFLLLVLKAPFLIQVEGPHYNTMELRETISHSIPWIYALSPHFTDWEIVVNIIFSCHTIFMYIFMSVLSLKFKFCIYITFYKLVKETTLVRSLSPRVVMC